MTVNHTDGTDVCRRLVCHYGRNKQLLSTLTAANVLSGLPLQTQPLQALLGLLAGTRGHPAALPACTGAERGLTAVRVCGDDFKTFFEESLLL